MYAAPPHMLFTLPSCHNRVLHARLGMLRTGFIAVDCRQCGHDRHRPRRSSMVCSTSQPPTQSPTAGRPPWDAPRVWRRTPRGPPRRPAARTASAPAASSACRRAPGGRAACGRPGSAAAGGNPAGHTQQPWRQPTRDCLRGLSCSRCPFGKIHRVPRVTSLRRCSTRRPQRGWHTPQACDNSECLLDRGEQTPRSPSRGDGGGMRTSMTDT